MRYHHFMPDENDKPATKADISLLRVELRAELATKTELREEISLLATKAELREGMTRLDKKIDRVAIEVVKTNERIGQLGEDLRQDMRQLNSDISAKLDVFIGKMETIWKESAVLPSVIDEHGHRLDVLESRVDAIHK